MCLAHEIIQVIKTPINKSSQVLLCTCMMIIKPQVHASNNPLFLTDNPLQLAMLHNASYSNPPLSRQTLPIEDIEWLL
ncbi:hypothetical protein VTJ04DRAFT_1542 [Mycothermus thermophilus]|uniref:uncharacterized protein n=1 Tax=Humicola insolens TaxID=85995 RepID=UPI003743898B